MHIRLHAKFKCRPTCCAAGIETDIYIYIVDNSTGLQDAYSRLPKEDTDVEKKRIQSYQARAKIYLSTANLMKTIRPPTDSVKIITHRGGAKGGMAPHLRLAPLPLAPIWMPRKNRK